jgi:predicted amidohydrolase
MPGLPIKYKGYFEGNAAIVDASGNVLAHRSAEQGEGIICAEILLSAEETTEQIPRRFWLRDRGFLPTFAWHHQRFLGRRWYKRNVRH